MLDDRVTHSRITTPTGRNLPGPVEVTDIDAESLQRRHEVGDVPLRPILLFAGVLLLSAVVIHIGLWWLLQSWEGPRELGLQPVIPPSFVTPAPMAGPGVEPFPWAELDALLTKQHERLNSYGWVDREHGVVHIPLARAMQLLVERGLPTRANGPAPAFGLEPAYELESEGGQATVPPNSAAPGDAEAPEIHGLTKELTSGEAETGHGFD